MNLLNAQGFKVSDNNAVPVMPSASKSPTTSRASGLLRGSQQIHCVLHIRHQKRIV
jgi:hypothetical protein